MRQERRHDRHRIWRECFGKHPVTPLPHEGREFSCVDGVANGKCQIIHDV